MTLEILVEREHEGARDAVADFESLYASTYPQLVGYCRRLLRSNADGEEMAQEAFLRAWQSWDRYCPSRPFWPWVATIARRLCIDRVRHSATASAVLHRRGNVIASNSDRTPDEEIESQEDQRLALAALKTLKPGYQRVIGLREIDGWTYEDIARFEDTTVESVRSSLRRARERLRAAYAKMGSSAPAIVVIGALRRVRRRL